MRAAGCARGMRPGNVKLRERITSDGEMSFCEVGCLFDGRFESADARLLCVVAFARLRVCAKYGVESGLFEGLVDNRRGRVAPFTAVGLSSQVSVVAFAKRTTYQSMQAVFARA